MIYSILFIKDLGWEVPGQQVVTGGCTLHWKGCVRPAMVTPQNPTDETCAKDIQKNNSTNLHDIYDTNHKDSVKTFKH